MTELIFSLPWSYAFTRIYTKMYPPRRLIIVYGNKNAADLIRKMGKRGDKYVICEAVSCEESFEEITSRIDEYEAVIINDIPHSLRSEILKYCLENSIRVYINPKLSDTIIRGADDFNLFDTPLLLNRNSGLKFEQRLCKRSLDIILSFIGLLIAMPFMLITSIAIKVYDRGPVFYKQKRLTQGGKRFYVYKFRSMIVNAEKQSGAMLAKENDSRITPVGRVIRKLRIDELPQLLNIFMGDMSFVGPRPERPEIARKYQQTMPEFRYRLKTKAGLTGYAQVMGVSLFSLLKNNTDSPELNIFIIDNNISDKNKDKVVSMCRSFDRGVTFIPIADIEKLAGTSIDVGRWNISTFARLFYGSLLDRRSRLQSFFRNIHERSKRFQCVQRW